MRFKDCKQENFRQSCFNSGAMTSFLVTVSSPYPGTAMRIKEYTSWLSTSGYSWLWTCHKSTSSWTWAKTDLNSTRKLQWFAYCVTEVARSQSPKKSFGLFIHIGELRRFVRHRLSTAICALQFLDRKSRKRDRSTSSCALNHGFGFDCRYCCW